MTDSLDSLYEQFGIQLPQRIERLNTLWNSIKSNLDLALAEQDLLEKLYTLAGSCSSFGADEMAVEIRQCEIFLRHELSKKNFLDESDTQIVDISFKQILQLARRWLPEQTRSNTILNHNKHSHNIHIAIAESEALVAKKFSLSLSSYGFEVNYFTSLEALVNYCLSNSPEVIVVDMDLLLTETDQGIQNLKTTLESALIDIPHIIITSVHDDITARYKAHQAGASRYFSKPIDEQQLTSTIMGLAQQKQNNPYRILLIDDDESILDFYQQLIPKDEIELIVSNRPEDTFNLLESYDPELIVLDAMMPTYGGIELASMIRLDDQWSQLPIVILSANIDSENIKSTTQNGDINNYISKETHPLEVISLFKSKAERFRWTRHTYNELQESINENTYRQIALDKHAIVSITNTVGNIIEVNDRFCQTSGYQRNELIGKNHRIINSGAHDKSFFQELWNQINQGKIWKGTVCNKRKDGSYYWVESTIVPFLNQQGKPYKFVSIRTDITDLIHQQALLSRAKEDAEEASKAKSLFLSNMSHELRTPLNAILGFSQLMEMDLVDEDQRANIHEVIKAGDYLLTLINDILDLAKIEAGKVQLSIETVDLRNILNECLSIIAPLAVKRGIDLQIFSDGVSMPAHDIGLEGRHVRGDHLRLKQVLLNLLTNAIKYNRDKGSVIIACEKRDNDIVRLSITDTGYGLDTNAIESLFNSFNRLGQETSGIEGTGIGLVISKNLIELMGGEIGVESKVGQGSTFWIDLHSAEAMSIDINNTSSHYARKAHENNMEHEVLYIEDNPANLKLIANLCNKIGGIHLHTAPEPELGIELARAHQPSLILLDINLPGMTGHEVLAILKQDESTRNIPVVGISANAMPADIEKARQSGFDDYLTKPVDIPIFMKTMGKYLQLEVKDAF